MSTAVSLTAGTMRDNVGPIVCPRDGKDATATNVVQEFGQYG